MFNKKSYKDHWLKFAHIVMIGVLFFAQLQLKFIERAYNDYGKATFTNQTKQDAAQQHITTRDNTHLISYTKLNKRYPVSSSFVVSSAPNIIHFEHLSYYPSLIYKQPFLNISFKHTFSLRGPPFSFC